MAKSSVNRTVNRMMIPCYLTVEEYVMFKDISDRDMRTMSGMMRVLIHREAGEIGTSPDNPDYKEEIDALKKEKGIE